MSADELDWDADLNDYKDITLRAPTVESRLKRCVVCLEYAVIADHCHYCGAELSADE